MADPAAVALPAGCRVVLASGSPRRAMLLGQAGLDIEIVKPDIDETPRTGESPRDYVARLSAEKAAVVADRLGSDVDDATLTLVVAADTTVECDGAILEKPLDDADARRMLRALGGRRHHVHTGVTVVGSRGRGVGTVETIVVTTAVTFVDLTDAAIDWYVGTGEPMDKAGAYAIQERGAAFVSSVDGSVTNVVGLPLAETLAVLARAVGRS